MTRLAFTAAALLATSGWAAAADLTVRVTGIADAAGAIRVAACTEAEFLKTCRLVASAPAKAGSLDVRIGAVPPGPYAIQAFHDRNGDGKLATNMLGIPSEPFGFSRAPSMNFGPPAFADAVVEVDARVVIVPVALRS
ncbi:DUF2141 domain-containing protein [Enterovirga sp. CN4-39]|uniref:DUF2141 domain-containing protein n=1 Tax=Enterovirga sp. CN4-39 TaxID=3400910 RepID=UPI003C107B9B